ncbi:MAG: hypothetical protein BroJett040_03530 [Oligoflexia bacterium]|nr:MAG: hypothetical protein BroJett040_03530 [Oligoflexia bacterium]
MSKVIGCYNYLPDPSTTPLKNLEYEFQNKKVVVTKTQSFVEHPTLHLNSRNATFLVHSVSEAITRLKALDLESPFDAGIYCAIEGGSLDYFTAALLNSHEPMPTDTLIYFENLMKNSPSVMAGLVGIQTKIMGPILTYPSRKNGVLHALEQAELHLELGKIKKAIVAASFAFDDPILQIKERNFLNKDQILSEGSSCLLLAPNGSRTNWSSVLNMRTSSTSYGIATPLIQLVQDIQNDKT